MSIIISVAKPAVITALPVYLSLCFNSFRKNVGWASTCNTIGQTAGYFLGNVVFLALESPQFCNSYLRSEPQPEGIVTLSGTL